MRYTFIFIFLYFCFALQILCAQDTLVLKKSGKHLVVKVTEIAEHKIYYKNWPLGVDSIVKSIYKDYLRKVILHSGKTIIFYPDNLFDSKTYIGQKRLLFKSEPLSFTRKTTLLWAEFAVTPCISAEVGYGMIGQGIKQFEKYNERIKGNELGVGVKLYYPTSRIIKATKPRLMSGVYWKPELNVFNYKDYLIMEWMTDTNGVRAAEGKYRIEFDVKGWALLSTFGYQKVFDFGLSVEIQTSIGLGKKTITTTKDEYTGIPNIVPVNGGTAFYYAQPTNDVLIDYGFKTIKQEGSSVAMHTRVKIGYLLWPKWKKK